MGEIAKIKKGIKVVRSMYNQMMKEQESPKSDGKERQEENDTEQGNSMEVEAETSLTENSEMWEPTPNGHEALEDTTLDSTIEQGARSCVAQRTRSHTEE